MSKLQRFASFMPAELKLTILLVAGFVTLWGLVTWVLAPSSGERQPLLFAMFNTSDGTSGDGASDQQASALLSQGLSTEPGSGETMATPLTTLTGGDTPPYDAETQGLALPLSPAAATLLEHNPINAQSPERALSTQLTEASSELGQQPELGANDTFSAGMTWSGAHADQESKTLAGKRVNRNRGRSLSYSYAQPLSTLASVQTASYLAQSSFGSDRTWQPMIEPQPPQVADDPQVLQPKRLSPYSYRLWQFQPGFGLEQDEITPERFAQRVMGPPDARELSPGSVDWHATTVSLGLGGSLIIEVLGLLLDKKSGPDVVIYGPVSLSSIQGVQDWADVFAAGEDGQFRALGRISTGSQGAVSLDLAVASLSSARYLMIQDIHTLSVEERVVYKDLMVPHLGFSLDSIELLNGVEAKTVDFAQYEKVN